MKRKTSIFGALAVLAGLFLASTPASAANYNGDCAGISNFDGQGDVTITDGACTLNQSITATGFIKITATSVSGSNQDLTSSNGYVNVQTTGNTTIGNVSARWYASIKANNITAGNVRSTTDGNVILVAQKNLGVGDVEAGVGNNVNLRANADGTNSSFTIGATGSNAVKSITAHPVGNPSYSASCAVVVTNGTTNSVGGITWSDSTKLSAAATANARACYVVLNAQAGELDMPTAVAFDGNATAGAGLLSLNAATINFPANAEVSASQPTGGTGTLHGVLIATTTINHNGLTIKGNGDGPETYWTGYVQIFPKGAVTIDDSLDPEDGFVSLIINFSKDGNITIDGSSLLTLQANGKNTRVFIASSKTTFSGGGVTIESKGLSNHTIGFQTNGAYNGSNGVAFTGNGNVLLDATAEAGADSTGGDITMYVDKVTMDAPLFTVKANGPESGNGDGGKITISTAFYSGFALKATSKAVLEASASSAGTGDAVWAAPSSSDPKAITLYAGQGTIKLGADAGQFKFSANGGASGGDAGSIIIGASSMELKTAEAINANARAGDGKGGVIEAFPEITAIDNTVTSPFISAKGHGSGNGGKFVGYQYLGASFDINKYIKVDGGDSIRNAAENDFGSITLNTIKCQQRTTGQTTWPVAYWNCANPEGSLTGDGDMRNAVVGLPNGANQFRPTLGAHNPQLYVMSSGYEYYSFFYRWIGQPIGYTTTTDFATTDLSVVFESTGSTDQSGYKPGNMMHEIGHLLNAYVNPNPTGTNAWTTKSALTEAALIGQWPGTQTPTCTQVFNSPAVCNAQQYQNMSPWDILQSQYMGGQPIQLELFAFAFQNCSGHEVEGLGLNNAERSIYMRDVFEYMDQTFWPGGCPWQP